MPNRIPWTQRTFRFDSPVDLYPELIARFRGTPARCADVVASVPPEHLTVRLGDTWSIQENIAHLADLEDLFSGRLDEFDAGAETLRAADMTNHRTHEANHNERPIDDVLQELRSRRAEIVARLEALGPADFARTSRHPRLDQPMRLVDMVLFGAEHDDYHLARVWEIARALGVT